MDTLHDFMHYTKGIEYVLAVVFLVGFIFFWKVLVQNEDHPPVPTEATADDVVYSPRRPPAE